MYNSPRSTDPDYEATKIDRSIKHLRPADEHENDSEAATVSGSAVGGGGNTRALFRFEKDW